MHRLECESRINKLLTEIWDICKEYNPNEKYISLSVIENEEGTSYAFNNEDWGKDAEHPINFWRNIETAKEEESDVRSEV